MMSDKEKQEILRKIFWDYNISGKDLLESFKGAKIGVPISREKIFLRMLERLGWYDILDVAGIETVKQMLVPPLIAKIRQPELRKRYEFIRAILSGNPVSLTGWGDEYYQQIKHTLFSHRWYRTQQTVH